MNYAVEMRRSPDITEGEVRRRLAACYRLLLDLAEKSKSDAPGDGCEHDPGDFSGGFGTDGQEPAHTGAGSGEEDQMDSDALADGADDR